MRIRMMWHHPMILLKTVIIFVSITSYTKENMKLLSFKYILYNLRIVPASTTKNEIIYK